MSKNDNYELCKSQLQGCTDSADQLNFFNEAVHNKAPPGPLKQASH